MLFEAERALRHGYRAWLRGELGKAISLLETSRAATPGSIDPLYPLSRALSESGEHDRAIAAIGEAIAAEPANPAGRLFRAIILLDHGDVAAARMDLEGIGESNPLRAALGALAAMAERGARADGPAGPVEIAHAARWIADAAGRILAVLEADLHAEHEGEAIDVHHGLFSTEADRARAGSSPEPRPPPVRASDRRAALARAFHDKDFQAVEQLHGDPAANEDWRDTAARAQAAFALIALGKEDGALACIREWLESDPESLGLHFLAGVAHARAGRRREAGWSFTRAARLGDTEVEEFLRELSTKMAGKIVWV
jgi:Flp pilus assembly protein TadD